MPLSFVDHIQAIYTRKPAGRVVMLAPRLLRMPLPIQRYDDPFLPFGKAIIAATRDLVCGYMFDLAAYMALGAAGMVALERTIAYAGGSSDVITLLHGPFSSPDFVGLMDQTAFSVDAVTLNDELLLGPFTENQTKGAFLVRYDEAPVVIPMPGNAGVYWMDAGRLTVMTPFDETVSLRLFGEEIVYAGRGEDFAERARAALEQT
jgi:hypothetical protein